MFLLLTECFIILFIFLFAYGFVSLVVDMRPPVEHVHTEMSTKKTYWFQEDNDANGRET